MKKTTQQEILLVTNSTLSQRQWCEKDKTDSNNYLSKTEKLEEACWNGILDELLPEITGKAFRAKRLFLWKIRPRSFFLEIELCESPESFVKEYSIDPYHFLETIFFN